VLNLFLSEKAYEINPVDPWVTSHHVGSLIYREKYEEAERILKIEMKSYMSQVSSLTHNQLIAVLIRKRDWESALHEMERWKQLFPLEDIGLIAIAALYFLTHRNDKFLEASEEVQKIDPKGHVARLGKEIVKTAISFVNMPKEIVQGIESSEEAKKKFNRSRARMEDSFAQYLRTVYIELPQKVLQKG